MLRMTLVIERFSSHEANGLVSYGVAGDDPLRSYNIPSEVTHSSLGNATFYALMTVERGTDDVRIETWVSVQRFYSESIHSSCFPFPV
jgi:hypothetical protein